MRWNKARKSFLAAAVALALSGSTGQAMPTGGVVDTGSVTGLVGGTVANGGTLTVNAPRRCTSTLMRLCSTVSQAAISRKSWAI